MKNISTDRLGKILKWMLIFIFVLGIFLTPFCHYLLHTYYGEIWSIVDADFPSIVSNTRAAAEMPSGSAEYNFLVGEIYIFGAVMLGIVVQLIRICRNIELNIPFDMTTHNSLKNIALCSLVLILAFAVKFAFFASLPGLLIIFTFVIVGMFASVFSQLFKRAAQYKEENDYTI